MRGLKRPAFCWRWAYMLAFHVSDEFLCNQHLRDTNCVQLLENPWWCLQLGGEANQQRAQQAAGLAASMIDVCVCGCSKAYRVSMVTYPIACMEVLFKGDDHLLDMLTKQDFSLSKSKRATMISWKIVSSFYNYLSFFKHNCQTFADSSLLKVRICCFSYYLLKVNGEPFCFGQLFGQKKKNEDVTLGCAKLRWAFSQVCLVYKKQKK